jgi:helix-hairpin-helix protein
MFKLGEAGNGRFADHIEPVGRTSLSPRAMHNIEAWSGMPTTTEGGTRESEWMTAVATREAPPEEPEALPAEDEAFLAEDEAPPEEDYEEDDPVVESTEDGRLKLTTATFDELRGVGMSVTQATRVLKFREKSGGFSSVDDLDQVPGFPKKFRTELKAKLVA